MALKPERRRSRAGLLPCAFAGAVALAALSAAPAAAETQLERGKYLVTIMDCTGCHTPGALIGKPDMARYLGGADVGFQIPTVGIFYPPNLTPDRETGLGAWSAAEIVDAVRKGVRPDGRMLVPVMPFPSYSALSDADAMALAVYLKSLPPVKHTVPGPIGSAEKAPAPYLTVVMPQ
jgi:mono/diheme cytochrome c family protein